jgi:hypothetical protein
MDVHKESISIAVRNSVGKIVMECVIETKASTIVQFIDGLRGDVYVTFEEGTWAAWLYDLIKPRVTKVVVCNPRKTALLKEGSKGDKIDARKLSELLRLNHLEPVYHGENGIRTLKELARSYLTITKDLTRVMNRLKALYRSWGIPCPGNEVYAPLTVRNGSARSRKPAYGGAPNTTTSSSMSYGSCARRCGRICWWKARNTRRGNCSARFRGSVRSGRRC